MGFQQRPREEPIPFAPVTVAIEVVPGKADLIEWTGHSVIRRNGQTGTPVWDSGRPAVPWKADEKTADRLRHWMESGPLPELVKSARTSTATAPATWSGCLAAWVRCWESGRNGSVLWEHAFVLDIPGVTPPDDSNVPGPLQVGRRIASLVDVPTVADLDGDGSPELVATIVFAELPTEIEQRSPTPPGSEVQSLPGRPGVRQGLVRRVVQAIAGRSGRTVWNAPIDPAFTNASYPAWSRPALIVPGREPATVAYVDGEQWIGLDGATGKPRGTPIDLGFAPVRAVQYASFDADGETDILATGPGQAAGQQTLAAFSIRTGKNLWVATVDFKNDFAFDPNQPPSWPLVVDLDHDGRSELAVPDSGAMPSAGAYRGVRLIDGQSGKTRWIRPMRPENNGQDGLLQILDAPDLDHDGVRDLITTSFFLGRYLTTNHNGTPPIPERIYVDALSGKDGHPLWWWHRDNATDRSVQVGPAVVGPRPRWMAASGCSDRQYGGDVPPHCRKPRGFHGPRGVVGTRTEPCQRRRPRR